MQPGSQRSTKHKVMPSNSSEVRFSISFRRILTDNQQNGDPEDIFPTDANDDVDNDGNKFINTSVIFGTSISKYLDEKKLQGKRDIKVINCSVSGATIPDVSNQMDTFNTSDHVVNGKLNVRNTFICVGTNDVAKLKNSTSHLYLPLVNLLKKAKMLFKGAKIYLQSLLPMSIKTNFTASNVLSFNKLALKACAAEKCFYLDVSRNFLDAYGCNNIRLFSLNWRTRMVDVHLNSVGISVLARSYIECIRGRFNSIKITHSKY